MRRALTKPIFSDDTGRRAAVLLWTGRVIVAVCGVLCVGLALTMTTHIALPGLDRLVSPTLNQSRPEIKIAEANTVGDPDRQPTTKQSETIDPTATSPARTAKPKAKTAFQVSRPGAATSPRSTTSTDRNSLGSRKAAEAKATPTRLAGSTVSQGRGLDSTSHPTAGSKRP